MNMDEIRARRANGELDVDPIGAGVNPTITTRVVWSIYAGPGWAGKLKFSNPADPLKAWLSANGADGVVPFSVIGDLVGPFAEVHTTAGGGFVRYDVNT